MRNPVSYDKELRDRAIAAHQGLFTIDLYNGSKKPGKLGSRVTMQGPASEAEFQAVSELIAKLASIRSEAAE